MQIKLENIGIVKNSSIELNGLTVITGKNNSGKSTVGKTLYALLDAVSNISEKYEIDRYNYMVKILEENQSIMSVFRLIKYGQMMEDSPTDDMNSTSITVWICWRKTRRENWCSSRFRTIMSMATVVTYSITLIR